VVVLSGLQGAVLETGGGSIRVDKCSGHVKATTGGGSVDLGDIGGPAEIETGAGSIRLASAKGRVQAQTGGGSIQLDGATSVQAETSAGGIVVKLLSARRRRALAAIPRLKPRLATSPFISRMISRSPFGRKSKWPMATRSTAIFGYSRVHRRRRVWAEER
jgi:hypothetical protein